MTVICPYQAENTLTGGPESDWNMTGIPPPFSSSCLFPWTKTHSHSVHRMLDGILLSCASASPFMLSFLVCKRVLQLVQLSMQDSDVRLGLQQRCPKLLIFLRGHLAMRDFKRHRLKTSLSRNTYLWEISDLSVQSAHLLLWLSKFTILLTLGKENRCFSF